MRKIGIVALTTAVSLGLIGVMPAAADTDTPAGVASLGSAAFFRGPHATNVPMLASCSVDGPTSASSGPVSASGVSFGGGQSSCVTTVVDPDNDITSTTSQASGTDVDLSALINLGGPRITIAQYQVSCTGTQGRTSGHWSFSGLTGLPGLPASIPPNYTRPITNPNGVVLANAVFDMLDQPGDGSTSLTMLQITFTPQSGIGGSVTIGTAACTPTP